MDVFQIAKAEMNEITIKRYQADPCFRKLYIYEQYVLSKHIHDMFRYTENSVFYPKETSL